MQLLNKILANQTQQYVKVIMLQASGIYPEIAKLVQYSMISG